MTISTVSTIGFIGLGTMGRAMSANLLKGGFVVRGFDMSAAAREALASAGGTPADSPAAAADGAELVIVMLPTIVEIDAVLDGDDGVLSRPGDGRLLMNSSTIGPGDTRALIDRLAPTGWRFLDVPVGRTAVDAVAGTSLFMAAGDDADKAAVRPVLEAMGDTIIDCGPAGHGTAVKLANNYLSIVSAVATAEALRLAESGGVLPEEAFRVINNTVAHNGHTKLHYPKKVLAGDVEPGFAIDLCHKDLGLAVAAMEVAGVPSFLGAAASEAYRVARDRGHGANDWSDMYNVVGGIWKERAEDE